MDIQTCGAIVFQEKTNCLVVCPLTYNDIHDSQILQLYCTVSARAWCG